MRNLPEWPVAFWGAVLAGAIVTPLNAWWTGPELEYGLQDSGSSIVIVDIERYERVREHLAKCPDIRKIYVSRAKEEIADPLVTRLETAIGPVSAWGSHQRRRQADKRGSASLGACPTTMSRSSTPPAPRESRRAR